MGSLKKGGIYLAVVLLNDCDILRIDQLSGKWDQYRRLLTRAATGQTTQQRRHKHTGGSQIHTDAEITHMQTDTDKSPDTSMLTHGETNNFKLGFSVSTKTNTPRRGSSSRGYLRAPSFLLVFRCL